MSSSRDPATEIKWFSAEILPNLLKNPRFIDNFNDECGDTLQVKSIDVKFIGSEEAFMLTVCYRVFIEYEYMGKTGKRSLVVKKTPEVPAEVFTAINFEALYSNEVQTYDQILPALEKYSQKKIVAPQYYYSLIQSNFCVIVLEDFASNGWRVTKDKVNLSLEHVLIAVKYLGEFHALGFAMRHQQPGIFDIVTNPLKESRFAHAELHHTWEITVKAGVERLMNATRQHQPSLDAAFINEFEQLMRNSYKYGRQRVVPVEPIVTLCHGDFLRNNVAYKYREDEPTDILMFDMQTMRVSSPMVDLSVFLSLSTYAATRHTHFERIFSTYCTELAATFTKLTKSPLPDFLCQDSLLKEYIKFLPYSLSIASCFLMSLVEPETEENVLEAIKTDEEVIRNALTRGGDVVDRELAHQVKEMYDLSVKHNVNIFEGFEWALQNNQ